MEDKVYEVLNKLNCCGCGSPQLTLNVIKEILNIRSSCEDYNLRLKKIAELFGVTEMNDNLYGLYQYLLYQLDEIEILEHGSSVCGAWLTDYGKELLKQLNEFKEEDYV